MDFSVLPLAFICSKIWFVLSVTLLLGILRSPWFKSQSQSSEEQATRQELHTVQTYGR